MSKISESLHLIWGFLWVNSKYVVIILCIGYMLHELTKGKDVNMSVRLIDPILMTPDKSKEAKTLVAKVQIDGCWYIKVTWFYKGVYLSDTVKEDCYCIPTSVQKHNANGFDR